MKEYEDVELLEHWLKVRSFNKRYFRYFVYRYLKQEGVTQDTLDVVYRGIRLSFDKEYERGKDAGIQQCTELMKEELKKRGVKLL